MWYHFEMDDLTAVKNEFERASGMYAPFNSAHEGYAVLLEEVEELWDEVKKSPKKRDLAKMKEEAIQVAAMALRFLHDCT
jgi:NTP pyrophosphatase (non-canonical NTP hydrolase)